MNNSLTNHIIHHILNNLGITSETKFSIKRDYFLLPNSIEVIDGDNVINPPLYGCEVVIEKSIFSMLLADFDSEFALITKLENCPTYGCYLSFDKNNNPSDGLVSFSLKSNEWLISNISIQANFLSGMENLKDVVNVWNELNPKNRPTMIKELNSFINYYDSITEYYNFTN